ncbi:MAG: NADH-quinone oxidoreductase subunit NuoK [Pirellulaceae bacterium]|nr:NADH-quinone oxidoreductase subunit NuoK [Pirellulaceae bacterium]
MTESTQLLLLFGAVMFTIGMVGFLTRRSIILMFLSLEMMLAGVSINLIAFSKQHHNYQGQVLAIMVLTVAACEAAIALAMVVSLYRRKATLDINVWSDVNETPSPPVSEPRIVIVEETIEYPTLTPAGLDPSVSPIPSNLKPSDWTKADDQRLHDAEVSQHA